MTKLNWIPGVAAAVLACSSPARGDDLLVFAAASLTDALKEIRAEYESRSADRVAFNFDGSGTLARQIAEGAPADLFFSADEARMDELQRKQLLVEATRRSLLSNTLVVVAARDSSWTIAAPDQLADPAVERIALADPASVPAGIYAKEYLRRQGLWAKVAPKLVPLDNVRSALAAVESGNTDLGFVYQTDAAVSREVKIVYAVPAGECPPITYPAAILRQAPRPEAAGRFLAYLQTSQAAAVFAKYGFVVLQP